MLYTSCFNADIIGKPIAISLYPPKGFKGDRLSFLTPTPQLLKFWKDSLLAEWEDRLQFRQPQAKLAYPFD